jgi:hypothetical protein
MTRKITIEWTDDPEFEPEDNRAAASRLHCEISKECANWAKHTARYFGPRVAPKVSLSADG